MEHEMTAMGGFLVTRTVPTARSVLNDMTAIAPRPRLVALLSLTAS
jgi:hypothetical protein